ncbi:Trp biosynthesis-associated membrane protein [Arthrobacter roseus]|uniref:Trp biosynthesis-associated membrane protein n=1 Tax=Arthrobacter roseus TaxID=136274 RepID=UPI001962C996|nr:Trp biosynthesis-associated membrane protein [Arthrobacter roseus]MBM7848427.1 putative membrane protein (TIGR02234 family) [Arthrobacter roseus]
MTQRGESRTRKRITVVLIAVLLSLVAFGATTQTWLSIQLPQTAIKTPKIDVAGSEAATAVTAFALVGLAASLAVSIAGPVLRWIIIGVLFVAGIGIAWSSAAIVQDPASAASVAVGTAIGITDTSAASIAVTVFPLVSASAGLLMAITAVWAAIVGRSWGTSRRYSSTARGGLNDHGPDEKLEGAPRDDIDSWDQLSHGDDPTR